mgnify:CR=1 FL=1
MDTIVIIGGGPSLIGDDVAYCEKADCHLLGINNAYLMTDKLNIHYACDTRWWEWAYSNSAPRPPQDHTDKYSLRHNKRQDDGYPGVTQMQMGEKIGLSRQWPVLCWGGNGGYQAINLVYLLGYKRAVLLGFDCGCDDLDNVHWHGRHDNRRGLTNPSYQTFKSWKRSFGVMADEVSKEPEFNVINCSRKTTLDCFPVESIEAALCG